MEKNYRVLLVDDEEEIREGMARKIQWQELGFEICATAENGREALEYTEKYHPDLIITDIQMPFMNGLEFISAAKKIVPLAKFVVFSGYDLFEYAQRAVSLHVTEYLLKPFSSQDLTLTLEKIRKQMLEEQNQRQDVKQLQEHFTTHFPLLKQNFLLSCLSGLVTEQTIKEQSERFELAAEGFFSVVLFDLSSPNVSDPDFMDKEAFYSLATASWIHKRLAQWVPNETFLLGDYLDSVLTLQETEGIADLVVNINEICRKISTQNQRVLLAGMSQKLHGLSQLPQGYRQAQEALAYNYRLDREEWFATYIQDIRPTKDATVLLTENAERQFMNRLKYGTKAEIEQEVQKIFIQIRNYQLPISHYQVHLLEYVTLLLKVVEHYQLDSYVLLHEEFMYKIEHLAHFSMEDIQQWFLEKCWSINQQIQLETADTGKALIQKAKHLVKESYQDPELTVEKISQQLFLSPAYFSTLFKKETGQSFITFLTEERLQVAMQLLETTTEKSYQIAAKVGYQEPNYFSYVFKKRFGLSPSKYRKQQAME